MGLFDFFKKDKKKSSQDLEITKSISPSNAYTKIVFDILGGRYGIPKDSKISDYAELFTTNSVVYTLVDWKALKSSQVKPQLSKIIDSSTAKEFRKWNGKYCEKYELRKLSEIRKSAYQDIDLSLVTISSEYWKLKKLLSRPNEFMTFSELIYGFSAMMDISGFCALWGERNKLGMNPTKSEKIYLLPSHLLNIENGNYKPVTGYRFSGDDNLTFNEKDVMHVKTFSPNFSNGEFLYGLSKVKVAWMEIMTFIEAQNREYYGFKSGDSATLVFPKTASEFPSTITTPTQLQAYKDKVLKSLKQKDRHKIALLDFAVEAVKIDNHLKDSITQEAKKEIMQISSAIFHLSNRVVFNSSEGATFNNLKEEFKSSLRNGVFPQLLQFSENFNEYEVSPNYQGHEFTFDFDVYPELSEDLYIQMKALERCDYLSDDEKRAFVGYDSLNIDNSNIPSKYWKKKV